MDGKQFHWRVRSIVGVLFVILILFAWVLYDLQYGPVTAKDRQDRDGGGGPGKDSGPLRTGAGHQP